MSEDLGKIGAVLNLDIEPFAESGKAALRIAQILGQNLQDALKQKPLTFDLGKIDIEVKKSAQSLNTYRDSLKETDSAQQKTAASLSALNSEFKGKSVEELTARYDELTDTMALWADAGKKGTLEYRLMQREQAGVVTELNKLNKELDKSSQSVNLFRKHKLNLGADLVIVSYGIRQVYSDLSNLRTQLQSTDKDVEQIAGSFANAGISILAMIPALSALKSMLPAALSSALPIIGAVILQLGGILLLIKNIKDSVPDLGRAFRWLSGEIDFSQGVKEFEDLQNAANNTLTALRRFGKEKEYFEGLKRATEEGLTKEDYDAVLKLDKKQEEEQKDKFERQQSYQKTLYDLAEEEKNKNQKTSSQKVSSTKQEENALDALLKKVREELTNAEYKNKLTLQLLQSKLEELNISKLNLKTLEEENKVYAVRRDIQRQIFEMTKLSLPEAKTLGVTDLSAEFKVHSDNYKSWIKFLQEQAAKEAERIKKVYQDIVKGLAGGIAIVDALSEKLSEGGKNFLQYLSLALKLAKEAVSLAQKGSSEDGLSFGDFLGFIGTVIPFLLNDGGMVPGRGNSDTVPALLTPGEVVINKPRVRELASTYGMNFLSWLNGGGSVGNIAGKFSAGGSVSALMASAGGGSVYLNGKILDNRMRQLIAKDGLYLEGLSTFRKELN